MADSITFEWDSGQSPEALADDLEKLEDALSRHLEEALETWALLVESTAKTLCPVDTGRLRASISSEVRRTGRSLLEASIGSGVEYAEFVERGTRYMEGAFFLSQAVESHLSDAERLFSGAVDAAVAEVA